jgi:hypothetical protein
MTELSLVKGSGQITTDAEILNLIRETLSVANPAPKLSNPAKIKSSTANPRPTNETSLSKVLRFIFFSLPFRH